MNPYHITAFLIYFSLLATIGVLFHKKTSSDTEFIMGERSLNFWVTALSAHASDMSNWLFMAFPAAIFIGGIPQIWIAVGLLFGMFLAWTFVAPKLRSETEKLDCYTLSSFFEKRFNDKSGYLRLATAVMILTFTLHYLAAGLTGMGFIFEELFHINYFVGISIATCVIASYVFIGGFVTVAWTDFFQGIFLLCVILLVPILAYFQLDGFGVILESAHLKNITFYPFKDSSFSAIFMPIMLVLGWGLGYFGQPHILTKFMGISSVQELKKARLVGMCWQFLALLAATFVGIVGLGFFATGLENPQLVFVQMVNLLFHPLASGFILCAIIAATVSTMDSQILVAASVMTEDLYREWIDKKASSKRLLKVSRLSVIMISILAYLISLDHTKTIMETVTYSWSGLGSSFGPILLFSLYSKRITKNGAIAGVISGGVIAALWPMVNDYLLPFSLMSMIPGFFISSCMILLVSFLEKNLVASDLTN